MYRSTLIACLLLASALPLAANAATAATRTPQQQRMADCSAKNKGLKGDTYKEAQRTCLSTHSAAPAAMAAAPAAAAPAPMAKPAAPAMAPAPAATATAATTPQQRMTKCNADASTKHLAGAGRKSFMSGCLSTH